MRRNRGIVGKIIGKGVGVLAGMAMTGAAVMMIGSGIPLGICAVAVVVAVVASVIVFKAAARAGVVAGSWIGRKIDKDNASRAP